jgi:hypothetical protein
MKTAIAVLVLLVLPAGAFARKQKKEEQNFIIETRDVPLGITTFTLRNTHEVKRGEGLYGYGLRIIPFAVQNLDGSNTHTGLRIRVIPEAWYASTFSVASVVFMVDGHRNETPVILNWIVDNSRGKEASEALVPDPNALRVLMNAKEVYLTILVPDRPEPGNQISFRLSEEQRNDCRMISEKYDEQPQP